MKEEDALSEPPERRGPKLPRRCLTLTDAVSESIPHIVERKVGVKVNQLCAERCDGRSPRPKRWRVAQLAANSDKEPLAIQNGIGPTRHVL